MKFCKDCWNFSRCNAVGRTVDFAVDDGVCCEFDEVKNMTNADRIRAMTDEELAEWIARTQMGAIKDAMTILRLPYDEGDEIVEIGKTEALQWLQQPSEGD